VTLVRVVEPHFVAGFETDGVVRRAAPIIKKLLGMTDEEARAFIHSKGRKAMISKRQH
jgi:hypothetical protein